MHLSSFSPFFLFFRPLYLPLRVLFTAESFSLSSNIIVDTATFHLRYSSPSRLEDCPLDTTIMKSFYPSNHSIIYVGMVISTIHILSCRWLSGLCFLFPFLIRFILDDSALYLSDKCETDTVDLRRGETHNEYVCTGYIHYRIVVENTVLCYQQLCSLS